MAYIYFVGSAKRGDGKSYLAQKLGMEFAVSGPEDFPTTIRTSQLIHDGDNVIFTTDETFTGFEESYAEALKHAKVAGTKLISIGMREEANFKE
jgi:hypothetical protein